MQTLGLGNNEENLLGGNSLAWRSVRHDGGVGECIFVSGN
jgi:hypothetical protein